MGAADVCLTYLFIQLLLLTRSGHLQRLNGHQLCFENISQLLPFWMRGDRHKNRRGVRWSWSDRLLPVQEDLAELGFPPILVLLKCSALQWRCLFVCCRRLWWFFIATPEVSLRNSLADLHRMLTTQTHTNRQTLLKEQNIYKTEEVGEWAELRKGPT